MLFRGYEKSFLEEIVPVLSLAASHSSSDPTDFGIRLPVFLSLSPRELKAFSLPLSSLSQNLVKAHKAWQNDPKTLEALCE